MKPPALHSPGADDRMAFGSFLRANASQVLARRILDEPALVAFRPWLHRFTELFIVCSCIGLGLALHGRLLLVPTLAAAGWLAATSGVLLLVRRHPAPDREYLVSLIVCSVSVLGWVAIVGAPLSSLVAFCNLVFITVLGLTLTPRAGFGVFVLSLLGLFCIRSVQIMLDFDPGLSKPPQAWIEAGQCGVIFLIHFLSVAFLVNLLWLQNERNRVATVDLAQTHAQLVAAEHARSAFLSTVTHELRTPLTAIRGYADLMLANHSGDTKGLTVVKRSAERLQRLIEELLNVADPPSLAARMQFTAVDLNEVVQEEIAVAAARSAGRSVPIGCTLAAPCVVRADRLRIAQVVSNLLENALQHTPAHRPIRVATRVNAGWAELTVEDAGVGIASDVLPHIFDPLYSKETTEKTSRGMGLGLAICLQIVEAGGGRIAVAATSGGGSTFTVRLPLAEIARPAPLMTGRPLRALVLDDAPDVLALMIETLSLLAFNVTTAATGPEALALALREDFDLLILDINVPGLSGIEVSRRLRSAGRPTRVFLFSASPDRVAEQAVADAHADGFIPKPFDFTALVEKLQSAGLAVTT